MLKPLILLACGLCCLASCNDKQVAAGQVPRPVPVPKVAAAVAFETRKPYIEALLEEGQWQILSEGKPLGIAQLGSAEALRGSIQGAKEKFDRLGIKVRLLISAPAGTPASGIADIIRASCTEGVADIFFLVTTPSSAAPQVVRDAFFFPAYRDIATIQIKLTAADAILIRKPDRTDPVQVSLAEFDEFISLVAAAAAANKVKIHCTLTLESASSYQRFAELLSSLNGQGIQNIMLGAPPEDLFDL